MDAAVLPAAAATALLPIDSREMKRKISRTKAAVSPRATLAIAGKERPPKIEKLKGDELPPPEAAARKRSEVG